MYDWGCPYLQAVGEKGGRVNGEEVPAEIGGHGRADGGFSRA